MQKEPAKHRTLCELHRIGQCWHVDVHGTRGARWGGEDSEVARSVWCAIRSEGVYPFGCLEHWKKFERIDSIEVILWICVFFLIFKESLSKYIHFWTRQNITYFSVIESIAVKPTTVSWSVWRSRERARVEAWQLQWSNGSPFGLGVAHSHHHHVRRQLTDSSRVLGENVSDVNLNGILLIFSIQIYHTNLHTIA